MYQNAEQRAFARALRNQPTSAEKHLWRFLRAQQMGGVKFRRQAAIGAYIADFVCFSLKLIIELDGPQHLDHEAASYDTRRTAWLSSQGFRVLRFRNQELDENIHRVIDSITETIHKLITFPPSPALPAEGRESE